LRFLAPESMIHDTLCLQVVEEVLCVNCVSQNKAYNIRVITIYLIKTNMSEIDTFGLNKVVPRSIRRRVGPLNQGH